jgi:hypothetical protein
VGGATNFSLLLRTATAPSSLKGKGTLVLIDRHKSQCGIPKDVRPRKNVQQRDRETDKTTSRPSYINEFVGIKRNGRECLVGMIPLHGFSLQTLAKP